MNLRWRRLVAVWSAIGLVVLTAFIVSAYWWFEIWMDPFGFGVGSGRIHFVFKVIEDPAWPADRMGVTFQSHDPVLRWLPGYKNISGPLYTIRVFQVPLWTICCLCGVMAWRSWSPQTRGKGLCVSCGYELSGIPGGMKCPECGTDVSQGLGA